MRDTLIGMLGNTPKFPILPTPWGTQALVYADVGARGGPPSNWLKLTKQTEYICFEPDPAEAASLRQFFDLHQDFKSLILTKALGSHEGTVNLNLTKFPPASSILQPNHNLLRDFEIHPLFELDLQVQAPIDTLDSQLHSISRACDFLKVDVQGYELEVLQGAMKTLQNTRGCELEVSFIEIYDDQPLFAEIDTFMRSRGFFLADLERVWWQHSDVPNCVKLRGSLAYGNALYLPNDITKPTSREQLLKSTIVCVAMGLNELAYRCAKHGLAKKLISEQEMNIFEDWMAIFCERTIFWKRTGHILSRLPGRQTLSRWLGLLSRALQGPAPFGADSSSWLRRNSW